jgi:hypothetical protein
MAQHARNCWRGVSMRYRFLGQVVAVFCPVPDSGRSFAFFSPGCGSSNRVSSTGPRSGAGSALRPANAPSNKQGRATKSFIESHKGEQNHATEGVGWRSTRVAAVVHLSRKSRREERAGDQRPGYWLFYQQCGRKDFGRGQNHAARNRHRRSSAYLSHSI